MSNDTQQLYDENRSYYDRNAARYERASWYYFNRYKNAAVARELRLCLDHLRGRRPVRVLEIGPGTGYLLGKILEQGGRELDYTGIEHSAEMASLLGGRYRERCRNFNVVQATVTAANLKPILAGGEFDLIMGSSILHHLPDYHDVVETLSGALAPDGLIYFVREPIHRAECAPATPLANLCDACYGALNGVLMSSRLRALLWPDKVKGEDASRIAIHMFKDGVSMEPFLKLARRDCTLFFTRKYNRRVSSLLSFLENQWLPATRKDIYNNTLFSVCLRKGSGEGEP